MLGGMLEGLLRVLFRVWTIGVFYFLNNRFLSWLNDSRTPKLCYQKLPKSEEERIIIPQKDKDSGLYSLPLSNTSWNNLISLKMLNSENRGIIWSQMTSMFSPNKKKQVPGVGDNCSIIDLVNSWDIPCSQNSKEVGISLQELYGASFCENLVPVHCLSRNFRTESVCPEELEYKFDSCINIPCSQNSKEVGISLQELYGASFSETLVPLHCLSRNFSTKSVCPEELDYKFDSCINKGHFCFNKENKKASENSEDCLWPEQILSSFQNDDYKDYFCHNSLLKEVEKHSKMETFNQEENLCQKEPQCSSAASIDSGFQSFCSINMTCLNIDGVILYVSNISHNSEGKIVAMDVGFSAAEDTSEESIFSDEDEDSENEHICHEEDGIDYCDSDDDFIVFGTTQCQTSEHLFCPDNLEEIAVAVDLPCQTFNVQISQSLFYNHVSVDECKQKVKTKNNSEYILKIEFPARKDSTGNSTGFHGAGTAGKKVRFNDDIEVHKYITWEYAYRQARLGPWKDLATDRLHFKRRIDEVQKIVEPILLKKIATIVQG